MRFLHVAMSVAAFAAWFPGFAQAEGYTVGPIGQKGAYVGCMAADSDAGLTFVGSGTILSVMMTAKNFHVSKGDAVDGTWSVDGGKESALAIKADGDGTVSADMQASSANLELLGMGNELTGSVGKQAVVFSLDGSKQALLDLGKCMETIAQK